MLLAIRVGSGALSLAVMALTIWCAQAEPARRSWTFAGGSFVLHLGFTALWTAQISYLLFALSRWTRTRLRRVAPSAWERFVFKGVRGASVSVCGTFLAWVAWSFLRGAGGTGP
jgi:hypothetical protein